MAIQVMQRIEYKYILSSTQIDYIQKSLEGHMKLDQYGLTSIASLYYDTLDRRLVRASIEKTCFKEKMRLRAYGLPTKESTVYLELKRKCNGLVYKRRIPTTIPQAETFFSSKASIGEGQIEKEINYFRDYYHPLYPSCLIIYDRKAFFEPDGDLRLTIDYHPRYRFDNLDLTLSMEGNPLLQEGYAIMEVKLQDSMPLWLSHILSEGRIYRSGFSKYGTAYQIMMKEKLQERRKFVCSTVSSVPSVHPVSQPGLSLSLS